MRVRPVEARGVAQMKDDPRSSESDCDDGEDAKRGSLTHGLHSRRHLLAPKPRTGVLPAQVERLELSAAG